MAKPNSEYQRAHRKRRATERQAMIEALALVRDELANSNTEKGKRLHAAALKALGEGKK